MTRFRVYYGRKSHLWIIVGMKEGVAQDIRWVPTWTAARDYLIRLGW